MAGIEARTSTSGPETPLTHSRKQAIPASSPVRGCGIDMEQLARQKFRQRFPVIAVPAREEMAGIALREAGMVEN